MKRNILTLILICIIGTADFAQNIIEPELQEFMKQNSDEKISVNIIFKSQLDVKELRTNSNNYLDKETKRQAVIKEFKEFSEASQQEVVSFIKSQAYLIRTLSIFSKAGKCESFAIRPQPITAITDFFIIISIPRRVVAAQYILCVNSQLFAYIK